MNYYQNYLDLLNKKNIIGGSIGEHERRNFRNVGSWMHYPLTWNLQNNQFYRWPLILKLIKLPPDTIKRIIGDDDMYINFLNCILVSIGSVPTIPALPAKSKQVDIQKILLEYTSEYNKHLVDRFQHYSLVQEDIIYVRNLINYFLETHKKIKDLLALNPQQDEENAKKIEAQLNICRDYYYEWRQNINIFYGIYKYNGLIARTEDEKPKFVEPANFKVDDNKNCFKVIYSKKTEINTAYKLLHEKSIISYLKIRQDADQNGYNQRFNIYVEPVENRLTQPQSMYLTGPNPNSKVYFYKMNKTGPNGDVTIKHIGEPGLAGPTGIYSNLILGPNAANPVEQEDNDVAFISKYDYGYLYGPFSRIFTPRIPNPKIAEECIEIINKIEANESVFVLGYGASGAGKTSALIYNKKGKDDNDKQGVLLQILKSDKFKKYKDIVISVHELYSTDGSGTKMSREYNNIKFHRNDRDLKFYIADDTPEIPDIEKVYTENVRTQLSKDEIERRKAEIKEKYDKDKDGNDVPSTNPNSSRHFAYLEALDGIQDIVWNNSIYKWKITKGPNPVFTGDDSIDDNIKNLTEKINSIGDSKDKSIEKANYEVLLKEFQDKKRTGKGIYDPRLICKTSYTSSKLIAPEDEQECILDDRTNNKPVKVNELGDLILTLVDRIRMVNPTTNNKQSSRSHVLIYVKLPFATGNVIDMSQSKYLIFGDLAGVENKFTCKSRITQDQFLHLDVIDRVTGKELPDQKGIPHYTVNTKIKHTNLPIDPKATAYYNFIGYDIKTKELSNDQIYKDRIQMLQRFSGVYAILDTPHGTYPLFLRNTFKTSVDPKFIEFQRIYGTGPFNSKGMLDAKTPEDITIQLWNLIKSRDDKKIDRDDYTSVVKFNNDSETQSFMRDYNIWKTRTNTSTTGFTFDNIALKIQETPKEDKNIPPGLIDAIKKYYSELYKDEEIYRKNYIDTPNEYLFGKFENGANSGKGLIDQINRNIKLLDESGVEALCNERMSEGIFINNALMGMSKNISDIIQRLNNSSDGDPGLLKNIPLVKEPCFKYFCNQDHETCFSQVKRDTNEDNNDNSIVNDIRSMIDKPNSSLNINKLGIIIFAVLNINKDANDPVKMPYTDLNGLKDIRDDYITYKFYNQENSLEIRKIQIKAIIDIFKGDASKPTTDAKHPNNSISNILTLFKDSVGDSLHSKAHSIYDKIIENYETVINPYFFKNLVELIDTIDIINSLSVIGTMNFLNSVKNIYSTDNTCNLINVDNQGKLEPGNEPIELYKNVMFDETLSSFITRQNKFNENGRLDLTDIKFNGPVIEPEKVNKAVRNAIITSESPSPIQISIPAPRASSSALPPSPVASPKKKGGNMNKKESLKNEYKELKKIYKQMKNQQDI